MRVGAWVKLRRKTVLSIASPFFVLIFLGGWLYLTGQSAKSHLESAKDSIIKLEPSDLTSNPRLVVATINRANNEVKVAHRIVSTGIWALADKLPILHRTAHALEVSTSEVSVLTSALSKAIQPLNEYQSNPDSVIDPVLVNIIADTVSSLNAPTRRTIDAIKKLDLNMVPASVKDAVIQLSQTLETAQPYLNQARPLIQAFPMLLGVDKPRTWLLVMNNGAESRATGGLPGGLGVLTVSGGQLHLVHQESNNKIRRVFLQDWQNYVSADQAYLYGDALGYWNDLNLSPDVPTNARLMHALYRKHSNRQVDGVMFMNQHTLAALMSLTGEIDIDGRRLSAENVADYVMRGVYFEHSDDQEKDAALAKVMTAVFSMLTDQHHDLFSIVKTLAPVAISGDLRVWADDSMVEKQLQESSLGGSMANVSSPTHIIAFNNGGGNKIDAYITESVSYRQGQCLSQSGYRQSTLDVVMKNDAPSKGLPLYTTGRLDQNDPNPQVQGSTRMVVYAHVPIGSIFTSASVNGKAIDLVSSGIDLGRVVWMFLVDSESKTTKKLHLKFMETALSSSPDPSLYIPPMAHPVQRNVTNGSRCG